MFDWIRERLKDADTKRQERVTAYVDGRLSAENRRQFEAQLAQDESLRAEVTALQAVKQQLTRLPAVRAPRNYTLDPAVYGAPDAAYGARLYPAVRFATAMAALMFIFMVTLTLLPNSGAVQETASAPETFAVEVQMDDAADTADEVAAYEAEPVEESADGEMAFEMAEEAEVVEEAEMLILPTTTEEMAVAAESAVTDDADTDSAEDAEMMADEMPSGGANDDAATNVVEDEGETIARNLPTVDPNVQAAPAAPEVIIPTDAARSIEPTIVASDGAMPDMTTERIEDGTVGETVLSAESQTAPISMTQLLLTISIILFVALLILMLWLRRRLNQF